MQSLWSDTEAAEYSSPLELRVYTSRLLGREPSLVLHGGGNTSVKGTLNELLGVEHKVMYVKSRGWDIATFTWCDFAADGLRALLYFAGIPWLSDDIEAPAQQ